MELPDSRLAANAKRLIGFEPRYARIKRALQLLIDSDALDLWSEKLYGKRISLVESISERYPLAVFHGDVGTGKTVTAECVSDALAREMKRPATLFKLSTRVRGTGNVGEMSMLINRAFEVATREAGKARLSFLMIDEADSIAANRNEVQSHHEDKVGVNTLIQRIDDLRRLRGTLVFLCTNRLRVLDPAILRRVAHLEEFRRPNELEREELLRLDCEGLDLTPDEIKQLVVLTGPQGPRSIGFTFSDLRTRLLPEALRRAFPHRKVTLEDLIQATWSIEPTPSAGEI
ncbi:MAG: ATP-binding protein [Candidatus Acidiferrales bacterium]